MLARTFFRALILCVTLAGCVNEASAQATNDLDRFARNFIATLSEEDVAAFKKAEKADLPLFHFGAGSRVRQLYFGPDGEGRKAFCTPGAYCDIDRESMRIVERTWQIIRGVG